MDIIESDLVLQKIELKKLRDPIVTQIGIMEVEKNVMNAENKISSFEDQIRLTASKLGEIEKKKAFLNNQIKDLRGGLSELERWKRSVAQEKIFSMEGLGYILVQNEITQIAGRLRTLQEALNFQLPMEELLLKNQANSLRHQEISQKRELQELVARRKEYTNERGRKIKRNLESIKRLEAQKVKFAFSRLKLKPYRVKQPISPRKANYITIGIFLSVIMGLFLPMVYRFIKSSFREISAQENGRLPG